MATKQELQVQEKQPLETEQESTVPARFYVPQTDIFEDDNALTVIMEMPGVDRDNVSVDLENNQLQVEGRIGAKLYDDMEPLYTEYNIGHYRRGFTLSSKIDRSKISADMNDGVLKILLPKIDQAKPRRIAVN